MKYRLSYSVIFLTHWKRCRCSYIRRKAEKGVLWLVLMSTCHKWESHGQRDSLNEVSWFTLSDMGSTFWYQSILEEYVGRRIILLLAKMRSPAAFCWLIHWYHNRCSSFHPGLGTLISWGPLWFSVGQIRSACSGSSVGDSECGPLLTFEAFNLNHPVSTEFSVSPERKCISHFFIFILLVLYSGECWLKWRTQSIIINVQERKENLTEQLENAHWLLRNTCHTYSASLYCGLDVS